MSVGNFVQKNDVNKKGTFYPVF